jgi:hypothetical protein
MAVKKNGCLWCHQYGLYEAFWRVGWRRPMEAGASGKPRFPKEPIVQCNKCHLPEGAPPAVK